VEKRVGKVMRPPWEVKAEKHEATKVHTYVTICRRRFYYLYIASGMAIFMLECAFQDARTYGNPRPSLKLEISFLDY